MDKVKKFVKTKTIWVVLIGFFILASVVSPNFLTWDNIKSVLMTESIIGILATGIMWCILSKGTDLSAGSMVALASCIMASLAQRPEYSNKMYPGLSLPVWIGIIITLFVGLIVGTFNGACVAYLKVPAFIATLGTQLMCRSIAQIYTDAYPVPELVPELKVLGQGMIFGFFPVLVLIFIIMLCISAFMLNQTRFGKNVYAIGGNDQAARVAGINVEFNQMCVFAFSSVCAALGGILLAARSGVGNCAFGQSYELDAIAAATVGGTSQSGGVATVSGVLCGVLILGIVKNVMILVGINAYWQNVVKGAIIIFAVVLDMRKNAKKN